MKATQLIIIAATLALAHTLRAQTATEVWATRYNGPANDPDYVVDLAVDSTGNVAITGYSYNGNYTRRNCRLLHGKVCCRRWSADLGAPLQWPGRRR